MGYGTAGMGGIAGLVARRVWVHDGFYFLVLISGDRINRSDQLRELLNRRPAVPRVDA